MHAVRSCRCCTARKCVLPASLHPTTHSHSHPHQRPLPHTLSPLGRESERLLGDEAAQRGEAALAEGVAYRYGLARGIHAASSSIASGLMVRFLLCVGGGWVGGWVGILLSRWGGIL